MTPSRELQFMHYNSKKIESTHPYPGRSTRYQLLLIIKWLISCVLPANSRKKKQLLLSCTSDAKLTPIIDGINSCIVRNTLGLIAHWKSLLQKEFAIYDKQVHKYIIRLSSPSFSVKFSYKQNKKPHLNTIHDICIDKNSNKHMPLLIENNFLGFPITSQDCLY